MINADFSKIKKNFVLQRDQQDCGPTCLINIVNFYKGSVTLEYLRTITGTDISGTTMLGLYQAASKIGFDAEGCEATIEALIQHPEPLILHLTYESKLHHYVVCYGTKITNDEIKFLIGDPSNGIVLLSKPELEKVWQSKGCITMSVNEHFIKSSTKRHIKIKWVKDLIEEDKPMLVLAVLLGLLTAALGMAMAIFNQRLIDNIIPSRDFLKLNLGVTLVLIILIIKESLNAIRQNLLLTQGKEFNMRIVDFFYDRLLSLPKPFFDSRKIGDLVARLNDTARIQKVISQIASSLVLDILVSLVSLVFLFYYSWQAGLISVCAIPFYFFLIRSQNNNIRMRQKNIMVGYSGTEANYISTLQGIEAIKNYNQQNYFSATNKKLYHNFQQQIYNLGKIQIRLSFVANLFGIFCLVTLLIFTSHQVMGGQLKIGQLIAIVTIFSTLLPSIANLALISIPINEAAIAFERMFEFTFLDTEKVNGNSATVFKSLKIDKIVFRFAGRSPIIKDVSFQVALNDAVGIMGKNGSGKSTLVQILLKNYNQESGQITLNNDSNLNDISITEWRKIVSVVPQNIHIFNGTILENICFDGITSNFQEIFKFLDLNGFIPFFDKLPQSFNTIVGEGGINLSGGQKQMVALARALFHNPQLLILDEATSAMDRESEQFVLKLLTRLKPTVGIIFITHRMHILKIFCDRIYILENGMIQNEGDHISLMQTENLYSKYWSDLTE